MFYIIWLGKFNWGI